MLPLALVVGYDETHRCWNDLKASLEASLKSAGLFRNFLAFGVIHNVNYGPGGSKTWFNRKRKALEEFCENRSCHANPFLAYMPYICAERGVVEDGTPQQREKMFEELRKMKGCQIHGPLTKLMRWYSWWDSQHFHQGEIYFTKLVMLHENSWEGKEGEADFETNVFLPDFRHDTTAGDSLLKAEVWRMGSGSCFGEQREHVAAVLGV